MEYNEKTNLVSKEPNEAKNLKKLKKKTANLNYVLAAILILLFIIFLVFYKISINPSFDFSVEKKKEMYLINQTEISELTVLKPNSYKEKITHFKLPNDVEIILMNPQSNKKLTKDSVGIIVGSGAMNDDKIEGLAHFTEHMLFLGSQKYSNETFFNDYITSNEGHFNGFTDKDTTTFIYEINKNKFLESLDVFLNFFVKPLFKSEYLEKEIFAVNSEFEKNIHSDEKRFDRLFQSMTNPAHPFSRFSTGNKKTLKADGITNHVLREKTIKYFHKHYIGRNIKIVVHTNHELESVKDILLNNMIKVHNHNTLSVKEKYLQKLKHKHNGEEIKIYTQEQKGKIIFYKSRYKTMKVFFMLKDMKHDLDNNPKMFFKILFSMKYKNSLLDNLMRQRLIFNYSVDFKDKYKDFNALYFKFLLTENGLKNLEKIIKMLSEFLQLTHENISNKKLFEQIKEINNKNFLNREAIKSGYSKLKKLTKNFYLFGKKNIIVGDALLKDYNHTILHEYVKNMTLANSQIYVGARSFKHFNKTYLYKVLNDEDLSSKKDKFSEFENNEKHIIKKKQLDNENIHNVINKDSINDNDNDNNNEKTIEKRNGTAIKAFAENDFLDQREKWYRTKYKVFNLDEDHIWHVFKQEINGTKLEYPDFTVPKEKKKILKKTSLCWDEKSFKKIGKKECEKLFINDRKISIPNFIYKNNYTEIYLKTDRLHLDNSFILNIKLIPKLKVLNLDSSKNIVMFKLLIIYLNFLYAEVKLKNNNFYDYQTQVLFKDNYLKRIPLFQWRNSKEKLNAQDFQIDGIYLKIKSKSAEIFDNTEVFDNLRKSIKTNINKNDFIYLKEELYRYIEFYKSSNPTHQAFNWLYRLGFKNDINYLNMTSAIQKMKMKEFNEFKNRIFNNTISDMKILMLGVGTLNDTKMIEYGYKVQNTFIGDANERDFKTAGDVKNTKNEISDVVEIQDLSLEKKDINENELHHAKNDKNNQVQTKQHREKGKKHHNPQTKKKTSQSNTENNNIQKFNISNIHQSFIKPPHSKYGNKYIYQVKNIYKYSPDSSTLNAYFLGENNIYNHANMRLINMIAGNIFFSYLRIKHQLGYSVKNRLININNNLLFTIYVQGSKKYPSTVHKHIEKVIYRIKHKIQSLDEFTFENFKNTVMDQMINMPYKLENKNNLYWGHLLGYDYIFPKKQVQLYMKELKTYDLEKFIEKILEYRLSVQVFNFWASNPIVDKESIYLDDVNHFRKTSEFIDSHLITDEISKPKIAFKPDEKFRSKK